MSARDKGFKNLEKFKKKLEKRLIANPHDNALRPNVNNGTETGNTLDFYSNGFKILNTGGSWNSSGVVYVYMAFAEHPFVSSKGVPVTAR